jgi:hypothetical protein
MPFAMLLLLDSNLVLHGALCCEYDVPGNPPRKRSPEKCTVAISPVFMRVRGTYRNSRSAFRKVMSMGFKGFPQVFCGFFRVICDLGAKKALLRGNPGGGE